MFKSKTVIVVGAGASCEAGLPSGEDIKGHISQLLDIRFDTISRQISGDNHICDALRAVAQRDGERSINPYLHKAWRIRDVVPTAISIDNFLDAHRGDRTMELCGKLGIVKSVLNAERKSVLMGRRDDDHKFVTRDIVRSWYVGFRNMLTENVASQDAATIFDNVTIITFNYDRCIEKFLAQGVQEYYELTDNETEGLMEKLPIFHPYGKVGSLPKPGSQNAVPFGTDRVDLLKVAEQIKTFTEGMDDEVMLARMHDAIIDAETLIFLGFAFHPINMQLLTPGSETGIKRVFATTLGLSDADEAVIEDDILRMIGKDHWAFTERPRPDMAKLKCGDFFREYFRSLSAPAD